MDEDDAPRVTRYRLRHRLGIGGLGVVYAAFDPQLGREIALKLIRIGSTDRTAVDRLQQEAKALARVNHPNVVGVFDVGRYDTRGQPGWPIDVPKVGVYIVMELVQGGSLRAWLETPRSRAEILRVLARAGRGLQAAHAAGMVHRDFKPANVLVDPNVGAKVVDFGLAQWLHGGAPSTTDEAAPGGGPREAADEPRAARSSTMTQTGTVMGTPAYMAPEQHRGDRADARSDQYSFCVALAEALCGERPFAGTTAADLHRAKARRRISPCLQELPSRLRATIERGLSPEPAQRWSSMDELLEHLARARPRRWPWLASAGLLSLAGGAGYLLQPSEPPPTPPTEPTAAVVIEAQLPSTAALVLRDAAERAWVADQGTALQAVLDSYPDDEDPDDPSLTAELLLWRGRTTPDPEALELFRRAYFLALEADVPSIAARAASAAATVVVGDHGQALDEWTRHAWAELHRGPWDRGAAVQVLLTSGYGRAVAFGDEQAAATLEFADAAIGDVLPHDGPYMAYQMVQLAAAWRYVDEPERGRVWAQRASDLIDGTAEVDHPVRASAQEEVGLAVMSQWPCYEALPHLERSRVAYLANAGDESLGIDAALAGFHIAECLEQLDRLDAAEAEYRRMVDYWAGLDDAYGIREIDARVSLARLLARQGRTDEAEREYERALEVVNPMGPDHPLRDLARRELDELRESSG